MGILEEKPWRVEGYSDIEVLKNPELRKKYWENIDELVYGDEVNERL